MCLTDGPANPLATVTASTGLAMTFAPAATPDVAGVVDCDLRWPPCFAALFVAGWCIKARLIRCSVKLVGRARLRRFLVGQAMGFNGWPY